MVRETKVQYMYKGSYETDKMNALQKNSAFKNLPPDGIEKMARGTVLVSHSNKDIIFREGEKSDFVYAIHSGLVKIYKRARCGEDVTFNICGPGEMLNVDVLSGERFFMSAEALTDVVLLQIERQLYCSTLLAFPEMALQMSAVLAKQINELLKVVVILSEKADNKNGQADFVDDEKVRKLLMRFSNILLRDQDESEPFALPEDRR